MRTGEFHAGNILYIGRLLVGNGSLVFGMCIGFTVGIGSTAYYSQV